MRRWTERDELIAAVAYALRQARPLLRRIVAETHPDPDGALDPATAAAERVVEHLERSRYEVRHSPGKPRGHGDALADIARAQSGSLDGDDTVCFLPAS